MAALRSNPAPWIAGTIIALLGVALARLVAPRLDHAARLVTTLGGQGLAFAGLFVICLGVRHRLRSDAASAASAPRR